jgi:hypothetical protein
VIRHRALILVAALVVTAGCTDVNQQPAPDPVTAYPDLEPSLCAALPFQEEARRVGLRRVGRVEERWHPVGTDGSGITCRVDILPTHTRDLPTTYDDRWRLDLSVVVADRSWNLYPFASTTRPGVRDRAEVQGWWGEGYSYHQPLRLPGYDRPVRQLSRRIVTHHNLTADISVYVGRGDREILARLGEVVIDHLHAALPAPVTSTPTPTDGST